SILGLHRSLPSDGGGQTGHHRYRQSCHRRLDHLDHERAPEHHGACNMSSTLTPPRDLHRIPSAASAGFTLIEMLVVLTIISLVLGLVGPRVLAYLGESRVKTARLQIESLSSALDLFFLDAGRYPSDGEGLEALAQRPPNVPIWNGPYLKTGRVPADPWGHPYQYRAATERTPPY